MADIGKMEDALIRAHEAGDYEGAQVIADEIRRVRSGSPGVSGAPESGGVFQTADDVMRLAANALTFNTADKLSAMAEVGPIDYFSEQGDVALAQERLKTDQARGRIRELGGGTWATVPESVPLVGGAEIGLDTAVDTVSGAALGGGLANRGLSLLTSNAGRAAGTFGRLGRAATEGAAYGAAYNVGSTDTGNLPDYVWAGVKGARDGALLGGGLQAAGQGVVGAGRSVAKNTRRLLGNRTAMDRTSAAGRRVVGEAIADDGITAANARRYGSETMLADNGVATRNLMRGAVQEASPEANDLRRRLAARSDRRPERLQNDVNAQLGPVQVYPDQQMQNLMTEMGRVSPRLQQVFQNAPPVDARGALTLVRSMLRTAEGPQRAALQRVERMLVERPAVAAIPGTPGQPARWVPTRGGGLTRVEATPGRPGRPGRPEVVKSNMEQLHNVKVTIDGMMEYGDPMNGIPAGSVRQKEGALRTTRRAIKNALDRVPGYDQAMDDYRLIRRRMEGLEVGRNALDKGKGAMRPDQLARLQAADGGNAAPEIRTGMRGRVDEMVGTADELPALRSALGGEYNWNRAKLGQTFGQDRVDNLVGSVDREMAFQATRDAGFGGSRSIENAIADAALQRATPNRMIRLVDIPFRVLDYVAEKVAGARSKNIKAEVARITGLQGDELTDFVRQMEARLETNRTVGRNTATAIPGLLNASGDDEAIPFLTSVTTGESYGYYDPKGKKAK